MTEPRLALVSGSLHLGGSTTFLVNLAGELVRRRVPVEVISLQEPNPLGADFERQKIPVLRPPARAIFEDIIEGALRQLGDFRPTHLVGCLGPASFETLRYAPQGVRSLGLIQSDDPNVYAALGQYAAHLDGVVAVSRQIFRTVAADPRLGKVPAHCLPYGIPMPAFERVPRPPDRPLRILYLGRLIQEQKRVHLFPKILQHLVGAGLRFSWTLAGDGPERETLERQMVSAPGREIVFTGALDYHRVPALLAEHDVFLLASDYEGLPLSLLEAMANGLVPVVSELPSGTAEVVDSTCGLLVPPAETRAYGAAILSLEKDRDLLSHLSLGARARVEREYSVEAMTDRWLAILSGASHPAPQWPTNMKFRKPLNVSGKLMFNPVLRPLRRLAKKMGS